MSGSIEVFCGPMFAGKTTELIRMIKNIDIAGYKHLIIKAAQDKRYSGTQLFSHDKQRYESNPIRSTDEGLKQLDALYKEKNPQFLFIEEVQFFPIEIIDLIKKYKKDGCHIVVAGLDMYHTGEPWPVTAHLLAIADRVHKRKAVCMNCKSLEATHTYKKVKDNKIVEVGANDLYEARCYYCWQLET